MSDNPDRVLEVLADVLETPLEQRDELLGRACGDQADLRAEVQRLLGLGARAAGFLDAPNGPRGGAAATHPKRLGTYRILRLIGEGGMGSVYEAEQDHPRRLVALKVIKLGMDTRQVIARFEIEREALALMNHPNIAAVHDAGVSDAGRPYFAMELVKGAPITEYCEANALPLRERLDLFICVCRAVQHAHQKGIIHRDLKPSNVLVAMGDGWPVTKIIDFGIAKATAGQRLTDRTLLTECRELMGTPQYMSPEQAGSGEMDIDTRSDIYSLGVLLYELLTGQTPFDAGPLRGPDADEVRRLIREAEPPRPSTRLRAGRTRGSNGDRRATLFKAVRGELDWIVMKCLEKDRTRRYETANELAADLERHLRNEPVQAGPPTAAYRLRKFTRRNRAALSAAAAMLVLLVGGIVGTTAGMLRARAAEAEARREAGLVSVLNEFFIDMFRSGRPVGAGNGRDARVVDVLDRAAKDLPERFHNQPEGEIRARVTLGVTYGHLGMLDACVENLTKAYELACRHLGGDSDEALELGARLALWMTQDTPPQTQLDEAEALAQGVKQAAEAKHGEGSHIAYFAAEALGWAHAQKKNYAAAEQVYFRMVEVQQRHPGATRLTLPATPYHGLGRTQHRLGKLAEAKRNQLEAIRLTTEFPYMHYPRVHAAHRRGLGLILADLGELEEAAEVLEEALEAEEHLEHVAGQCAQYPHFPNHPWVSPGVMLAKATAAASASVTGSRASAVRSACLTLDHAGSMGDRSGEYGGNGNKLAPRAWSRSPTSAAA